MDAWIDRFTSFPDQGWPQWMVDQIETAQFVIVIATRKYAERFTRQAAEGEGLGATWEGGIITSRLYWSGSRNKKFIPVFFSQDDAEYIPLPLKDYTRFRADTDDGYCHLYRHITDQPEIKPVSLEPKLDLPSGTRISKPVSLSVPPIYNHVSRLNLPRLPYGFFGREDELTLVAKSLESDAPMWGSLICGPGGIGKTALAIRAAELASASKFDSVVYLASKAPEPAADSTGELQNLVVPPYLNMLNELARQIGQPDIIKLDERQRPAELQRALQGKRVLVIFENLESFPDSEREHLFNFLSKLPRSCKAVVTSRLPMNQVLADLNHATLEPKTIRLGKLSQPAALDFIASLAKDRPLLQKASAAERIDLSKNTDGNPLLIHWVAGQVGRGKCPTLAKAVRLLASTPAGKDPLEFVLGDLVRSLSTQETQALAALTYFTVPMTVKSIAKIVRLPRSETKEVLVELADCSLCTSVSQENDSFGLAPLVASFLRRTLPKAVRDIGQHINDWAYMLAVTNGYTRYDLYHMLDGHWPVISAALPLFLVGSNERLQTVCEALLHFLDSRGYWDEWLWLERKAEERAVSERDFRNAGWRAEHAGWLLYYRGHKRGVLECADRVERYWKRANVDDREQGISLRLRGMGYHLAKNYKDAIVAHRKAVKLWRDSEDVRIGLDALASSERLHGNLDSAQRHYEEALRIATDARNEVGIATSKAGLSDLAMDRRDWEGAEKLVKEGLDLADRIQHKKLIASNCIRIAKLLVQQGRKSEAHPHVERAVKLCYELRLPDLDEALSILKECKAVPP